MYSCNGRITGIRTRNEFHQFYRASELFVRPSVFQEIEFLKEDWSRNCGYKKKSFIHRASSMQRYKEAFSLYLSRNDQLYNELVRKYSLQWFSILPRILST